MATLLLFASAREAAGVRRAEISGNTVAEVVDAAVTRFGPTFASLLPTCRIWVNGESADPGTPVSEQDEVAVLPPVSGGAGEPG